MNDKYLDFLVKLVENKVVTEKALLCTETVSRIKEIYDLTQDATDSGTVNEEDDLDLIHVDDSTWEDFDDEPTPPQYKVIFTGVSISVQDEETGDVEMMENTHPAFEQVKELALVQGQFEQALDIMRPERAITRWASGALEIEQGQVKYQGHPISNKLVDKILNMMKVGDSGFERYAKFLQLTQENPSFKTRMRLMDFASCSKITVNEQGHVVAFKNVDENYMDWRTRSFRNMVGDTPSEPRHLVDDDHDNTCSNGLHVCSPFYLKDFWGTRGKTMKVTIHPKEFVAIPHDYNDTKARVCTYTVVEDVTDYLEEYLQI